MKTKDHEELSRYLMEQFEYPIKKNLIHALILGSIEPDYNPITYLRGSMKLQKLRGHNFENAHTCIEKLIRKLDTQSMSEVKRCYLLGKLIHYVADAFTFPHNKAFNGSLSEHCAYEKELHFYMKTMLNRDSFCWGQAFPEENLMEQIDLIHGRYLEEQQTYVADCYYILNAVTLVFGYFSEEYADCWNEQIA
ncbi:hypothetical protein LAD12857_04170 [Lacrimispora amygdalina]|uniref:Phospholipase C/D domain-containing protein n=1 Tax=Lacrimispora amygdalina TaxID=253257 RepID=A0ABQ5M0L0_9FIRM|nr:zinc dependent phospholipase C family protein [Haloimpatiens lingqiaonensis]